eukprot:8468018-Ditylum_brightwellii.AAC.1
MSFAELSFGVARVLPPPVIVLIVALIDVSILLAMGFITLRSLSVVELIPGRIRAISSATDFFINFSICTVELVLGLIAVSTL